VAAVTGAGGAAVATVGVDCRGAGGEMDESVGTVIRRAIMAA